MRVLQINAVYKTKSTGRITMELHDYFTSHGIDSYVAYGTENTSLKNDSHIFMVGNWLDHKIHALLRRIDKLQGCHSKHATKKLLKRIKILKPDIVLMHNLHSNFLHVPFLFDGLQKLGIMTIIAIHDCWFVTGGCYHFVQYNCNGWLSDCRSCKVLGCTANKKYNINKTAIKGLNPTILATSKWIESVVKQSPITRDCRIDMIYDWVDMKSFFSRQIGDSRKKYRIKADRYIVGVSVDWSEEKGKTEMVEAASLFPDLDFVLIGNQLAPTQYPSNVITISFVEDKDILAELYSGAEMLFNPSKQETFGLVSAESLSCGTPVVVYNVTACPEFVNEFTGYVMDLQSDIGVAISTLLLRNQKYGRDYIRKKCQQFAKNNFDLNTNIGKYILLMKEMIGVKK